MCNLADSLQDHAAAGLAFRDKQSGGAQLSTASHRFLSRSVVGMLACLLLAASATGWAQVTFNGAVSALETGSVVLNGPQSAAVDSAGNVYIASYGTGQIVKIDPQQVASVLTINGLTPALAGPWGLAVSAAGNLYIADRPNKRLVEVSPAGIGSVVNLGSLTLQAPEGVALDAAGNLFISDTGGNQIVEVPISGAPLVLDIAGLGKGLNSPAGVAVDAAGNLYIADDGNNRIVKVAAAGTAGTTLSLSGLTPALAGPQAVAVDQSGNLYIADSNHNRIIQVTSAGAESVLNTGALTLRGPDGVTVDMSGTVYIADTHNSRVVKVALSAVGFGHVPLGSATATSATLSFTVAAATTLGSTAALTLGAQNLDFTLADGSTCTGGTEGATCTVNVQFSPTAAGLRRGAVVLCDSSSNPLLSVPLYGFADAPAAVFAPNKTTVIATGNGPGFNQPYQVAADGLGNIYATNSGANNILEIPAGGSDAVAASTGDLTLSNPSGIAIDGAGNLFIADRDDDRIVVVTPAGAASALSISGLSPSLAGPAEINFDAAGRLYIADSQNGRIVRISSLAVSGNTALGNGAVVETGIFTLGTGGVTGVAVDPAGSVYLADSANNRVIQVNPAGAASVLETSGIALASPDAVAADATGNIFIADTGNSRVVEVTSAGTSAVSASVLPIPANLASPSGVSADAFGNIYIADTGNNRIVEVPVSAASTIRRKFTALTPTIVWNPPAGIIYGNNLSGALNATAISEGLPLPGTFSYTATPSGGTASIVTNSTVLPVGTYTLTAAFTPTDTTDYLTATASVPFAVTKGTVTVTVVSSQNPVLLKNAVTFTATVSSLAATPTGTVTFLDGATQLGSPLPLAGGTAALTTSSLAAGTHSISALYSGDSNYDSGNSTVLSQSVEDFSFSFASTVGVVAPVVFPGGSVSYALQINPTSGPNFPSAVTFAISGLPAGAKATFTPPALAAGAAGTNVTLVVQLANQISAHTPANPLGRGLALAMMGGMCLLPFGGRLRRRAGRAGKLVGLLLLLLGAALGLTACGGGGTGYFGQQIQTYTLSVTATSGNLAHTTTVILTVQ